jgi:hypothetical protein
VDWKRSLPFFALIAVLTLVPFAALAQSGIAEDGPPPASDPVTSDTWLGALAAIGCGFMVRATIATAGTQVGTIAGAVACCGYALFDAFVVEGNPK